MISDYLAYMSKKRIFVSGHMSACLNTILSDLTLHECTVLFHSIAHMLSLFPRDWRPMFCL